MIQGSDPCRAEYLLVLKMSRPAPGPTCPIRWVAEALSWGLSGQGVRLITHLNLVRRLRMSGAIPLLTFMPSCLVEGQLHRHVALSAVHVN
jgi:hypothetical protein